MHKCIKFVYIQYKGKIAGKIAFSRCGLLEKNGVKNSKFFFSKTIDNLGFVWYNMGKGGNDQCTILFSNKKIITFYGGVKC